MPSIQLSNQIVHSSVERAPAPRKRGTLVNVLAAWLYRLVRRLNR